MMEQRKGENFVVQGTTIEMVWIRPGTFTMGSPEDEEGRYDDERQHGVTLTHGYWLGKYPVTQGDYKALTGNNPSRFDEVGERAPVERVSWEDAMAFCRKMTKQEKAAGCLPQGYEYTLPTEAQWKYACRAGTQTRFSFGDDDGDLHRYGNYADRRTSFDWSDKEHDDGHETTAPVGSFKPNAWGLFDMHGNVWEWCRDWYDDYPTGAVTDPTGSHRSRGRMRCGGGWHSSARDCRAANRYGIAPGFRSNDLGFRLALAPVEDSGKAEESGDGSDAKDFVRVELDVTDVVIHPSKAGTDLVVMTSRLPSTMPCSSGQPLSLSFTVESGGAVTYLERHFRGVPYRIGKET